MLACNGSISTRNVGKNFQINKSFKSFQGAPSHPHLSQTPSCLSSHFFTQVPGTFPLPGAAKPQMLSQVSPRAWQYPHSSGSTCQRGTAPGAHARLPGQKRL